MPIAINPPVLKHQIVTTLELSGDDLVDNSLYLNKEFLQLLQEDYYYHHIYKSPSYFFNHSKFLKFVNAWREQTTFSSSPTAIIENKNFQALVNMGPTAIPFILNEIENYPSNIVWVLNKITKSKISNSPISIEDACKLWVNWGRKNKLL